MKISEQIQRSINRRKRGEPFTSKEFLNLGSRAAVDQSLARLARRGAIRRILRGVYVKPEVHPVIGEMSVPAAKVVEAIARSGGHRVEISGAEAANRLGLSTQLPVRAVYITDGPSRTIHLGKQPIEFRHVSPSRLVAAGTREGVVVQALHYLGAALTPEHEAALRETLSPTTKTKLIQLLPQLPSWMAGPIRRVTEA